MTDNTEPILVEFSLAPGLEQVGIQLPSGAALAERSAQAVDRAMSTIRSMAYRVATTVESMPDDVRPSHVEVQFGIKLTVEGNAAIAKAGAESTITVKFTWNLPATAA